MSKNKNAIDIREIMIIISLIDMLDTNVFIHAGRYKRKEKGRQLYAALLKFTGLSSEREKK